VVLVVIYRQAFAVNRLPDLTSMEAGEVRLARENPLPPFRLKSNSVAALRIEL
jgi:hypothetical protein